MSSPADFVFGGSSFDDDDDDDSDYEFDISTQTSSTSVLSKRRRRREALEFVEPCEAAKVLETSHQLHQLRYIAEEEEDPVVVAARLRRGFMVVSILFGLLTLGHSVAAFYLFMTPEPYENPYECITPNCKRMGKWLAEAMDRTVDPCENFYRFSCGGFLAKNPPKSSIHDEVRARNRTTPIFLEGIPYQYSGNAKLGKFLQPRHKFPINQILPYYKSCIFQKRRDINGLSPFFDLLARLKLLYLRRGALRPPSVSRLIVRIFKTTNKLYFFDMYDSVQNFITLGVARSQKEILLTAPDVYADTMTQAFKILREGLFLEEDEEIETIVWLVMRFEAELVMIQAKGQGQGVSESAFGSPDFLLTDFMPKPKKLHRNYLQHLRTATFGWDEFVTEMFVRGNSKPRVVFFNHLHSIMFNDDRFYMLAMEELLRKTPYYTIFRFFQWSLLKLFAFDLTQGIQDTMVEIFRWVGPSMEERCFRSVFSNLNSLAAERYALDLENEDFNSTDEKLTNFTSMLLQRMLNVTDLLPSALTVSIMDTFSSLKITEAAIQRMAKFNPIFYEGLNMTEAYYFQNVLQTRAIRSRNEIWKVLKIHPYQHWPLGTFSLSDITLTYLQDENSNLRFLNVPFGSLYEPFMGNDLPVLDFAGYGYWVLTFYMMLYTVNDLLNRLESERHSFKQQTEVAKQKEAEAFLLPRLECIYDSMSQLELDDLPNVKLNAFSAPSRVKNIADVLSIEMLIKVIEHMQAESTPAEEEAGKTGDSAIFPEHQILPGFHNYSVKQLLFQSVARQACRSSKKETLEYLLRNGPTPYELRINGAFRLTKSFADTWSCPKKSFMNPRKKCEFFRPYSSLLLTKDGHVLDEESNDDEEVDAEALLANVLES